MDKLKWVETQLQLYQKLKKLTPDQFRQLKAKEQFDGQPFELGLRLLKLEEQRDNDQTLSTPHA